MNRWCSYHPRFLYRIAKWEFAGRVECEMKTRTGARWMTDGRSSREERRVAGAGVDVSSVPPLQAGPGRTTSTGISDPRITASVTEPSRKWRTWL